MPEPEKKKRLELDVDLDPAVTSDELADPAQSDERARVRSLIEDVPPHHGS